MSAIRIKIPARLDKDAGSALFKEVRKRKPSRGQTLVLDFSDTREMDTLGGACLIEIADHLRRRQAKMQLENQRDSVAQLLEVLGPSLKSSAPRPARRPGFFEEIGGKFLDGIAEFRQFLNLCVDAVYWTSIAPLEGRGFRWNLLIDEIHEMGARAVGIVTLMNFLLGIIIAMLSAKQVEAYGVQIFVANLIMIGFARELAAVMTAVVVSARTGAAIAAELATMQVQEEIDALRGMGININQFLIAPKLLALTICMPCLWVLGLLSGILGGFFWGVFALRFQPDVWFNQTLSAAHFNDLLQGFLKVLAFAIAIALIGCHNGLRVTGGSRGVGLMTTRAVVMDIFSIITIDIVFATIFYYILK